MSTFLNINLDRKFNLNFAIKHFFFTTFWLLAICVFIFRIDEILLHNTQFEKYGSYVPLVYIILLLVFLLFNKWYFILAFFIYPVLLIFWFIPKSILSVGKIYMFGNYINSVISWFYNIKFSIFNLIALIFTFFVFFVFKSTPAIIFVMCSISYFYFKYLFHLIIKAFRQPSIFGNSLEETIKSLINRKDRSESFLLKSVIINHDDEKLEVDIRREKQIRRVLIFNFCADLLKERIVGHRGKQAYMISWLFGAFMFLIYSILFFSFMNLQLFKIDNSSFIYSGDYINFDFFYYTLKTITFGDIEIIKPISIFARILEISSFFIIGIFILIIFLSIILSMKQDRLNENLKLTTQLIDSESSIIKSYVESEFGSNIKSLAQEVKNIDDSIKNIRNFIERLF